MPISSTEISNLFANQLSSFSSQMAYAQAITVQNANFAAAAGGPPPEDPTASSAARFAGYGDTGSTLASAPNFLAGGASLAAAFGFAPRFMGPFESTLRAGQLGMAGAGWSGAVGMGLATAGVYGAIGYAGDWATSQMQAGAQERGLTNAAFATALPNASSQQLGMLSGQVENAARSGIGSVRDITAVMTQALNTGAIELGSITEFSTTFNRLLSNVRTVATTLRSTLSDAYQAMSSVKSFGLDDSQSVAAIQTMRGVGLGSGLSPARMFASAQMGGQYASYLGSDPMTSIQGAVVSSGVYEMARAAGVSGINDFSQQQYTQAALRFFGSNQGTKVLGAMMDPGGELDMGMAARIASGALSKEDIQAAYARNISNSRTRDLLQANSGALAGTFISQFDATSFSPALRAMTAGSDMPESLQQMLTGLTGRDLDAVSQMHSKMGELRAQMFAAARNGLEEGMGRRDFSQVISEAFNRLTRPIQDQLRGIGAAFAQYTSDVVEDVRGQFIGAPAPNMALANAWQNRVHRASVYGGASQVGTLSAVEAMIPEFSRPGTMGYGSPPSTMWGQLAADFTPTALQLGRMAPGTGLDDLPMYGFGLSSHQPWQSAAVAASIPFAGRNALWAGGEALGAIGRGFAPPRVASGWTGMGMLEGSTRMAGGALRGAGFLARGLGRVTGALALPLLGYDLLTNEIPELRRQMGYAGITEGQFTGQNAEALVALQESGVMSSNAFATSRVGSLVGGVSDEDVTAAGWASIAGTFKEGRQMFLTRAGREELGNVLAASQDSAAIIERYGERRVRAVVRSIQDENPTASNSEKINLVARALGISGANKIDAYAIAAATDGFLGSSLVGIGSNGTIDMEAARGKISASIAGKFVESLHGSLRAVDLKDRPSAFIELSSAGYSGDKATLAEKYGDVLKNLPGGLGGSNDEMVRTRAKGELATRLMKEGLAGDRDAGRISELIAGLVKDDAGLFTDAGVTPKDGTRTEGDTAKTLLAVTDSEEKMVALSAALERGDDKGIAQVLKSVGGNASPKTIAAVKNLAKSSGLSAYSALQSFKEALPALRRDAAIAKGASPGLVRGFEGLGRASGLGSDLFKDAKGYARAIGKVDTSSDKSIVEYSEQRRLMWKSVLDTFMGTDLTAQQKADIIEYAGENEDLQPIQGELIRIANLTGKYGSIGKAREKDPLGLFSRSMPTSQMRRRAQGLGKRSQDFLRGKSTEMTADVYNLMVEQADYYTKRPDGSRSEDEFNSTLSVINRALHGEEAAMKQWGAIQAAGQPPPLSVGKQGSVGTDEAFSKLNDTVVKLANVIDDVKIRLANLL